jgi:lysozyme
MKISTQGMIDIIGREGICLSPYLDSVGVWTIGAGQTKSDGIDPAHMGKITVDEAISIFKMKLKQYTDAVDAENTYHQNAMTQFQYDALASACYNFGPGNLHQLCRHRTLEQIGAAIMLYTRPPEITARRHQEQTLYLKGIYSNPHGQVLLFPVTASHRPDYHHGSNIDIRPYFASPMPANAPTANNDIAD